MRIAKLKIFYTLPYDGTYFVKKNQCDIRVRHDLIKAVEVDEVRRLVNNMIENESDWNAVEALTNLRKRLK